MNLVARLLRHLLDLDAAEAAIKEYTERVIASSNLA